MTGSAADLLRPVAHPSASSKTAQSKSNFRALGRVYTLAAEAELRPAAIALEDSGLCRST